MQQAVERESRRWPPHLHLTAARKPRKPRWVGGMSRNIPVFHSWFVGRHKGLPLHHTQTEGWHASEGYGHQLLGPWHNGLKQEPTPADRQCHEQMDSTIPARKGIGSTSPWHTSSSSQIARFSSASNGSSPEEAAELVQVPWSLEGGSSRQSSAMQCTAVNPHHQARKLHGASLQAFPSQPEHFPEAQGDRLPTARLGFK